MLSYPSSIPSELCFSDIHSSAASSCESPILLSIDEFEAERKETSKVDDFKDSAYPKTVSSFKWLCLCLGIWHIYYRNSIYQTHPGISLLFWIQFHGPPCTSKISIVSGAQGLVVNTLRYVHIRNRIGHKLDPSCSWHRGTSPHPGFTKPNTARLSSSPWLHRAYSRSSYRWYALRLLPYVWAGSLSKRGILIREYWITWKSDLLLWPFQPVAAVSQSLYCSTDSKLCCGCFGILALGFPTGCLRLQERKCLWVSMSK
jgi:hypothetical protein